MKKSEKFFVRVSFNEEHHFSPEFTVATKSSVIELPLKLVRNKNGRLIIKDEDNKSLMHNYTKKFLEECNLQFGLKQKLKHIF